tara:strand:+ start:8869 stop:9216 length:348 start_codon:yes stop_codon:yes gene_type:complete
MTAVVPILFLLTLVVLFAMSLSLMWKNMSDINKPIKRKRSFNHPEMDGIVNEGDELLVIKFSPEVDETGTVDIQFTPDSQLEDNFLKKSLELRIDELEDDDEEDEGDGDVPALLK